MGPVKGFTDIIAPQNLATNGDFRINQRGLFTDFADVKNGDYVSDAWTFHASTVDWVQARNLFPGGSSYSLLQFRGAGKKGQEFIILSKDSQPAGNAVMENPCLTSAVIAAANSPNNTVPMRVNVIPRLHLSGYGVISRVGPIISRKQIVGQAVTILSNSFATFTQGDLIQVSLLADGEFEIQFSNFQTCSGAYMNPPKFAPVPYADDLLRCKRYYQMGRTSAFHIGRDTGTSYSLQTEHNFEVEMAGTPSVVLTPANVTEEGGTANVMENYWIQADNITPKSYHVRASKVIAGSKPSQLVVNFTASV